jgi:diguanylate cyclase (GGDEF)-like protein
MSLYRQLWLAITVSVLIALGASLFAALMNARGYLEEQLSMKNRDNAATLALAISQTDPDVDDVILAVTAQYDSGQYEAMQVVTPSGKVLVEKIAPDVADGAPDWFMRWLPIRPAPGQARITSGWTELGRLTLLSHSHFAYQALWDSARTLTVAILFAGLLGGVLGSLVLRRIRKPLDAVIDQARAISERRFITIPEPSVPELKQLAAAMNDSVERIRQMLEEDAADYETLRRQANYDPLTGLVNREFILASLGEALDSEETTDGRLAIVRLNALAKINRAQGREAADEVLCLTGRCLSALAERIPEAQAARLGGADFAVLLPAGESAQPLLERLLADLQMLLEPYSGKQAAGIAIGFADLQGGEGLSALLARVDAALASAESSGGAAIRQAPADIRANMPGNAEQWRLAIRHALSGKGGLKLVHHAIRNSGDDASQDECPLRIRVDEQGDWLPARHFIGQAERLGLIQELDLAAVSLAIEELAANPGIGGLWVIISARSVSDSDFRRQLVERLRDMPAECGRLWLEVPETGAMRRLEDLRTLISELKPLGCHVGLEHYGHRFDQVGQLSELGLDFLKVDAGFIRGIDANPGNQAFLSGLRDITHALGILLYAEGVESEAELRKLEELGFDGVTGAAVGTG